MTEHKARVTWTRTTPDFQYETYDRTHQITFEGGISIKGSAAKEFAGRSEYANPEELLLAAAANCHLLTFLAIAAKSRLTVESYEDNPVAVLEKNADGVMMVTKVYLKPKVIFGGEIPDAAKIASLHDKAHRLCFIANSIRSEVSVLPLF